MPPTLPVLASYPGRLAPVGAFLLALASAAPVSAQRATAVASPALTAADKLDIAELAARFEMALDAETVDGYLATFTPDGRLHAFGRTSSGPAGLRRAFDDMLSQFARGRRHTSMNQVVTGDRRAAVMRSYLVVFNRNDFGRGGSAVVTDSAVHRGGRWLLQARRIDVDSSFLTAAAATGAAKH